MNGGQRKGTNVQIRGK